MVRFLLEKATLYFVLQNTDLKIHKEKGIKAEILRYAVDRQNLKPIEK